jgi:DNA-directed RNA polymerase specialized sigma24 family protein
MSDERLSGLLRADMLEEILRLLSPEEALLALLRLNGVSDEEVAEIFGVDRSTVARRMIEAGKRIARELPEAAVWLEGRRRRTGRKRRADE